MWFVNANVVDVATGERLRGRAVETAPDGTVAQVVVAPPPGLGPPGLGPPGLGPPGLGPPGSGPPGPSGAADGSVVDVGGRWLLPGLISCHTHLSIVFGEVDEDENPALTAYRAATRATAALRAGITTIRCVHEQNRADLLLRTAVGRGWYQAPRILGAGRAVSAPGGHGAGGGCAYATGEEEFYRAALAELEAGADHVKIFISGGLNRAGEDMWRPELTDGEIRGVVRAAGEHDTYVVAHSGGAQVIQQALAQGVRCFEHIYSLDDETAARLARPGIFVTPTLCVTRSASWMRATGFPQDSIDRHLAAGEEHLASVQRAIRAGVTLVNGTDIPPGDPVDGTPAAVYELLMLAEAGLSPLTALQSASVHAAGLLGIGDHVGQVRPGYAADFVAVAADPLADLAAMRTISLVVQGGRLVRDDAR
jgi:imidazolonepropionase-like amidohydrolase